LSIYQRASAPIAVAGQRSDLLANVRQQLLVGAGRSLRAAIDPRLGSVGAHMNV
jgi:hypothetical protein